MPSSVIVEARKYVIAELDTRLTLDPADALITYAWRPDARERCQIFTMRPRGEHNPAALTASRMPRNERAEFQLVVHVEEVGEDQEFADESAIEYGRVVEEFFADTKTPPVVGMNWWRIASWELGGGPTDRGSIAQLIYTVEFDARLT